MTRVLQSSHPFQSVAIRCHFRRHFEAEARLLPSTNRNEPRGRKKARHWAHASCSDYPIHPLPAPTLSSSLSSQHQMLRSFTLSSSPFKPSLRKPSRPAQCCRRNFNSSAMAAVAATSSATAATCFVQKSFPSTSQRAVARPVVGLPALRMPRIVCSAERKDSKAVEVNGLPQLAAAVTSAATMAVAHPAFALVDERLSGEGTGLGLGISNSKLTWILVGVTALIWILYFLYSSNLPEGDDDSGLSL